MKQVSLRRLRPICLALPEAEERETWGEPTFRVRDKIFCMHRTDTGAPALWCKAPPGSQAILVGADAIANRHGGTKDDLPLARDPWHGVRDKAGGIE